MLDGHLCGDWWVQEWKPVVCLTGSGPTPRHSHAAVVHGTCMYCFGGYDGMDTWPPQLLSTRLPPTEQ